MKNTKLTYDEAAYLALEVFPRIAHLKPISEVLVRTAKEEGYAEGSFRRRFYAWDKAMMSHPKDGGVVAVLMPTERSRTFTKELSIPLNTNHRSCYTVWSYESFLAAYDRSNHYMTRCKESKLKRLYALYKFLSERPSVFHWGTISTTVKACLDEYKGVRSRVVADDLFVLYKIGVLILDPPI